MLGTKPATEPAASTAALGDWYAKPVPTAAGDLVVFMSSVTYLSVALPAANLSNLPVLLRMRVYNLLRHLGIPDGPASREVGHYDRLTYTKTNSRRLLGILNEVSYIYQWYAEAAVGEPGPLLLSEAERRAATTLLGAPDYTKPVNATREQLRELS